MTYKKFLLLPLISIISVGSLFAQYSNSIKVKLIDSLSKAPVEFATVYVSPTGSPEGAFYALTDDGGEATIVNVKRGKYIFKAEIMGYRMKTIEVNVDKKTVDLGTLKMQADVTTLEQVVVSAVGNPIVVKKDTIEYNAASFKTTDNDMLEELLKKLPGVEVASDGSITANGQTITKITIDGKTFFLDDPQLATKNIPAKIIQKVKVVEKKSEQAEFTGIDDGEEETIIDLSIMPGMMRGWFGNVAGGGGHDIQNENHDARWQGSTMIGRFTDKSQISIIGNGNNTNNRGFQDMAGDMMNSMRSSTGRGGGMMGGGGGGGMMGGGGSGITTSWMGGVNANGYLFKNDAMKIGGNYLYSGSQREVEEHSVKTTMLDDQESITTDNAQMSVSTSQGHRAGVEADWKISDKTSILFRPQFNYGYGDYMDSTIYSSVKDINGVKKTINDGSSLSTGVNDNWRTSGRLLIRQRIGAKKGRTVSLNINYSVSDNEMNGINRSVTNLYADNVKTDATVVDQHYSQKSNSYSLGGRLSYTEPLGKNFFLEATYNYRYNQSNSEKLTYDYNNATEEYDRRNDNYSSRYRNTFINQNAQLNLMKQEKKYNLQLGFSVQPSSTKSITTLFNENMRDSILAYSVLNFSPSARFDYRFSDYKFVRVNYRGSTNQPTITQLQPVPDNSNPLYISLGNPSLQPEFTHDISTDYRYTNMKTYASMNTSVNFSYTKDDIVTASWYDSDGVQYSAPVNAAEGTYSANVRFMFNTPIAKSKFSIMSFTFARLRSSLNYTGTGDVKTIDEIIKDLIVGRTTTLSVSENLSFVYRDDIIEARLGGNASYSNAWYAIKEQEKPSTWTNSINGEVNATMPWGTGIKTDARYTFYIGFTDSYNQPQLVWNAEISQLLFKKKATLRFKVYDILNQARTVYRSTADNYVQDVQQNTLGQYFMISLTFRFGNFSNMSKGMGGGPGRGPGGRPGGGTGRRPF